MKSKVINVSYRKDSNTFPDWMKYEVELLNEDGSTTKIPAYGKDLQDALSRVVHDYKVEKIEEKTKRIPDVVWIVLWFGYIFGWTMMTLQTSSNEYKGLIFMAGIALITSLTLRAKIWFRLRNKDK
mgnify:CR=1 FL=1